MPNNPNFQQVAAPSSLKTTVGALRPWQRVSADHETTLDQLHRSLERLALAKTLPSWMAPLQKPRSLPNGLVAPVPKTLGIRAIVQKLGRKRALQGMQEDWEEFKAAGLHIIFHTSGKSVKF